MNGLSHPLKLSAIQGLVHSSKPHVFVISETKNSRFILSQLSTPDYQLFESPGWPISNHLLGKWDLLMGVRKNILSVEQLALPDSLKGHAIALDITIPTTTHGEFWYQFIGLYAPWNPNQVIDDDILFWPEITRLCTSAKFSWSIIGDLNATLSSTESTWSSPSISSQMACTVRDKTVSMFLHLLLMTS